MPSTNLNLTMEVAASVTGATTTTNLVGASNYPLQNGNFTIYGLKAEVPISQFSDPRQLVNL